MRSPTLDRFDVVANNNSSRFSPSSAAAPVVAQDTPISARNRLQHGIRKPRIITDGTIRYVIRVKRIYNF